MARTDAFTSLEEVRREQDRLRGIREVHAEKLKGHWGVLRDPDFRRGLLGDAFGEMLKAWKPMRAISGMFTKNGSDMGALLGMALGARSSSWKGKIAAWLAGLIVPMLLRNYATPERTEKLFHELRVSWERIRERMRNAAERERDTN